MLFLSRPPVASSPLPSRRYGPRPSGPRPRATSASARMLTTLARSFASWPSGRSGWLWKSAVVMTTPSTESPRNSRRSFVGSPPFSYAYDRWVRARSSRSASRDTPNADSRCPMGGRRRLSVMRHLWVVRHLDAGGGDELGQGRHGGRAVQAGG